MGGLESLRSSLDFEREKIQEWREFHAETVWSIIFHYAMLLLLFATVLPLTILADRISWDRRAVFGVATWFLCLVVLWIGGASAIGKWECKRHNSKYGR